MYYFGHVTKPLFNLNFLIIKQSEDLNTSIHLSIKHYVPSPKQCLVTATIPVTSKEFKEETKPKQKQLTFMELIQHGRVENKKKYIIMSGADKQYGENNQDKGEKQ